MCFLISAPPPPPPPPPPQTHNVKKQVIITSKRFGVNLISSYLISSNLSSHLYLISISSSSHIISSNLISISSLSHLISSHFISSHLISYSSHLTHLRHHRNCHWPYYIWHDDGVMIRNSFPHFFPSQRVCAMYMIFMPLAWISTKNRYN